MSIANKFISFTFIGTFIFNVFASAATKVFAHRQHCGFGAENRFSNYMVMSTITYYGMIYTLNGYVQYKCRVVYLITNSIKLYVIIIDIWCLVFNFLLKTIKAEAVTWSICCILANLGICVLGCWRCFANNYLHWAATCTWLLLNLEGKCTSFIIKKKKKLPPKK